MASMTFVVTRHIPLRIRIPLSHETLWGQAIQPKPCASNRSFGPTLPSCRF